MDYAAPALLGLLAVLGIAIFSRLGHLKKEGGAKRDPEPQANLGHAVRMYAVTAKSAAADDQTVNIQVKYKGAGGDLLKAIASNEVTEVFLKGCAFAVAKDEKGRARYTRAEDGTDFTVALDAGSAMSPFIASGGAQDMQHMADFGDVYIMAH